MGRTICIRIHTRHPGGSVIQKESIACIGLETKLLPHIRNVKYLQRENLQNRPQLPELQSQSHLRLIEYRDELEGVWQQQVKEQTATENSLSHIEIE